MLTSKKTHYAGIEFDDVANGEGVGAVFFTQYCPHHCIGCQNPQTWNKDGGMIFTETVFNILMKYYKDVPFANRLTLSGGDPLANIDLSYYIASSFKNKYPDKKIWIYTGFTFEEIVSPYFLNKPLTTEQQKIIELLKISNVLIDEKFDINKRDITLQFKGSSNQRIINIQESLKKREVILYA